MYFWVKSFSENTSSSILRTDTSKIYIKEDESEGLYYGLIGNWATPDSAIESYLDRIISYFKFFQDSFHRIKLVSSMHMCVLSMTQ
jgi:hypothetical protein